MLAVKGLRVWYGTGGDPVRAVDGISLEIAAGETVGLVGESGCGKSTLGRAILGLLPENAAAAGEVLYRDRNMIGLTPKELRDLRGPEIGLIFQEPMTRLDPLHTIEDHFLETLHTHEPDLDKDEMRKRSLETLARMGIPPTRFKQYPHEFSGGMRQRIMIALALVLRPSLLIADEPTTALDVIVEAQILGILADLRANFDTGLLLITHNLGIVAEACNRVAVMYAGRIVESGRRAPGLLRARPPLHARAAALDDLAAHHRPALHPGRAAEPGRPATRLPLPPALPERDAGLRREVPGRDDHAARPASRVLAARPGRGNPAGRRRSRSSAKRSRSRRKATAAVRRPARLSCPVRVRGLETHYAVRGSFTDRLRGREAGAVAAVDGVDFDLAAVRCSASSASPARARRRWDGRCSAWSRRQAAASTWRGVRSPASRRAPCARCARRLQIVFQDPHASLNPAMTIGASVGDPLRFHGIAKDRTERERLVAEALERVGLAPAAQFADKYPTDLSGGQKQRAVLARAIILGPDVLVADEPVSMLDMSVRAKILELMIELKDELDLTYIYITHDLATAKVLLRPDRDHVPRQDRRAGAGRQDLRGSQASVHGLAAAGDPRA